MDHGLDINRLRRIRLYLLAELMDNTDNRMLTCLTVHIPDCFKNLLLAEHPSGLLCQIEKNTKEVLEEQFADELGNGTVVFRIIDISDPENEEIADKYEVSWSSLFVCKWKDGKETYENLTEYAFANARTSPDTFKSGLTEKINELLK